MDPNAALLAIRSLMTDIREEQSPLDPDVADLLEAIDGLDQWLSKGGFLPQVWARSDPIPIVESVVVRDPDGPTDVSTFINGQPVKSVEYVIDAGAGHMWEDWVEARDANLAKASSPAVREALLEAYADPPGGEYVEDREYTPWLDGVVSVEE